MLITDALSKWLESKPSASVRHSGRPHAVASQCKRDSDSTSEPWVAAMSVGEGETAMSVSETSLRDVRCAYENGES